MSETAPTPPDGSKREKREPTTEKPPERQKVKRYSSDALKKQSPTLDAAITPTKPTALPSVPSDTQPIAIEPHPTPAPPSDAGLAMDAAEPEPMLSDDTPAPYVESDRTATRGVKRPQRPKTQRLVQDMPAALIAPAVPVAPQEPDLRTVALGIQDPLAPPRLDTRRKQLITGRLERELFAPELEPGVAPPVIEVESLEAGYENKQVLRGLTFDVRRGEILVILGGSGSGKTTLLRHMIGLQQPARGTIKIGRRDIAKLEGDELAVVLRGIGMLFQYSALFSAMSVGENVGLPLREYTDLPEEAINAIVRLKLALVGLPGTEDLMPSQLSGGMKKRVALARAVVLDPDVVFFDEPASGLDPIAAAELDALITHLNRSFGTTMVIVTHDLENAFNVAHRMLVIDRGRIAALGTPTQVRASSDPWIRAFIHRETSMRHAPDEKFYAKIAGAGRLPAGGSSEP